MTPAEFRLALLHEQFGHTTPEYHAPTTPIPHGALRELLDEIDPQARHLRAVS